MASSSVPIPEITFLHRQTTPKRRLYLSRNSLSNFYSSRSSRLNISLRTRIRAVREEGVVVEEERDRELIEKVNGAVLNGNGAAASTSGKDYGYNGSVVDGIASSRVVKVESVKGARNGTLVKYLNGNGVASEVMEEVRVSESKEKGRKERIEEIGKEEAWFKQSGQKESKYDHYDY